MLCSKALLDSDFINEFVLFACRANLARLSFVEISATEIGTYL
jgi:hypothetical protein